MQRSRRVPVRALLASATLAGLAAAVVVSAPLAASAQTTTRPTGRHSHAQISNAVFVQTNDTTGNQILAYSRSATGSLSFVHAYDTGGRGARTAGSVVDPLASPSSLYYEIGRA